MKKLIVMIALVVGATTFAQERKMEKKAMHAQEKVEKLTKELDLTQEQQEKVRALFDKKNKDQKEIRAEEMAVKKAENTEFDKEIRAILTPEQTKKWDAKKAEQKRKMSGKTREHKKESDLKKK